MRGIDAYESLILPNGRINPMSTYLFETIPLDPNSALNYIGDGSNVRLYQNYFRSADAIDVQGFWDNLNRPYDHTSILGDNILDQANNIWPLNLKYQAVQKNYDGFGTDYHEHGLWAIADPAYTYGADFYFATDTDTGINDILPYHYEAVYGRRSGEDFGGNVGFDGNSYDTFFMDGRLPFQYYSWANPAPTEIGRNGNFIPNVDYILFNKQTTVDYPFGLKKNLNNIYTVSGDENDSSSLESQRRSKTYDAVFYVHPTGNNSGSVPDAVRKNNKAYPFQTLSQAWSRAFVWQESTGEKALVWMMTGVHTSGTSLCRPVDLYFDYKAIFMVNTSLPALSDVSNSSGATAWGNFDVLGQGIFINTSGYAGATSAGLPGGRMGIGIVRGGRIFGNIQAEFIDQFEGRGYSGGAEWWEPELRVNQYWSRNMWTGGVGRWSGDPTFVNTTFLHGILSQGYIPGGMTRRFRFKDCVFSSPYIGSPDLDIYDNDGNIVASLPMIDTYDTSAFTDSQQVADDLSFLGSSPNGFSDILALVELTPSANRNFISTIRQTRWQFDDCTFLINKGYIFAVALVCPFQAENFASWGEQRGYVTINGGEVYDWSGAQGGSAFCAITRYTTSTRDNPYLFVENLAKWTGDNFGWPKYIETQTVTNPNLVSGGSNPAGWANGTYGPLPNGALREGVWNEVADALDISGVTDNVWSKVTTPYRHAKIDLLVEAVGPGNPNIDVFVRQDGSTNTTRGGGLTQHTQLTIPVKTNSLGEFEILQTDKDITQVKIISYTSNRKGFKE